MVETKQYFRRRGASNFMLDVVLLMNNSVQLKTLLIAEKYNLVVYFTSALIFVSIILQVIVGVLVVIQSCFEEKHMKKKPSPTVPEPEKPSLQDDLSRCLTDPAPSDKENQCNNRYQRKAVNKIFRINTLVTIFIFLILVVNIIIHTLTNSDNVPSSQDLQPSRSQDQHLLPFSSQDQDLPLTSVPNH